MGEVSPAPETAARVIEDLTSLEVDSAKGERLYKAALIRSKSGTTYRMLAKSMKDGKLDLVHYGCTLDEEGKPTTKWAIRRIMEQKPERFDREIDKIQSAIRESGEDVDGVWTHDLTTLPDVAAQAASLESWTKNLIAELKSRAS
ncbi:MAG TPA: hypothetical protein VFA38_09780 [Nitrospirales bacterium]|nr:hypothetical protein [Nitrospirales bacterium]